MAIIAIAVAFLCVKLAVVLVGMTVRAIIELADGDRLARRVTGRAFEPRMIAAQCERGLVVVETGDRPAPPGLGAVA